jgi:hypothetical protein
LKLSFSEILKLNMKYSDLSLSLFFSFTSLSLFLSLSFSLFMSITNSAHDKLMKIIFFAETVFFCMCELQKDVFIIFWNNNSFETLTVIFLFT